MDASVIYNEIFSKNRPNLKPTLLLITNNAIQFHTFDDLPIFSNLSVHMTRDYNICLFLSSSDIKHISNVALRNGVCFDELRASQRLTTVELIDLLCRSPPSTLSDLLSTVRSALCSALEQLSTTRPHALLLDGLTPLLDLFPSEPDAAHSVHVLVSELCAAPNLLLGVRLAPLDETQSQHQLLKDTLDKLCSVHLRVQGFAAGPTNTVDGEVPILFVLCINSSTEMSHSRLVILQVLSILCNQTIQIQIVSLYL